MTLINLEQTYPCGCRSARRVEVAGTMQPPTANQEAAVQYTIAGYQNEVLQPCQIHLAELEGRPFVNRQIPDVKPSKAKGPLARKKGGKR